MSTTPPPPTTLPVPSTLLPAPKPLDTSDDAWLGWRTWKSEFELFATATQLTKQPTDVQAATFLVSIGEEGRKAFSTFKFDADEDRNDVKVLIKKFEDYYKPANNLTLHEFRFGSRDQKEGEPFNDWLIELKILAKNCEFGLLEDRMLRSRIVLGVQDKRLQQKLLAENPSYQKTVEICRIEEQGKQHFQEISAATGGAQTTIVNSVAREKKLCSRCGYQMHLGGNCPARGKNCTKCGAQNHFAQVCKSVGATHNASRPGKELREVRAETDDFFLEGLAINSLEVDKWTATVYIEGQPVTCKLDTGANCCVISKNELERLPAKPKEACKVTLTAFFGHRTTAQAKVKLLLYANNKKCEEQFFVVEHDLPVTLSGAVAERLGFIYRIQKVSSEELYRPAQPFADVFSGLGQLKGVEYSMKLKPGSAGTVVPARRVPIALQDKVLAELQRMEQQGVITKAEVHYLGHILTTQGLRIDPERVQDILEIPEPKTSKQLQIFLGTMNYVQRFIPNMSVLTEPLRELLRKDNAWVWTEKQQASFEALCQALITAPILSYFDPKKAVTLSVDASQSGVGAVLMQDGHPVAFSSRSLTEAQQRYAQIEKETLAIVHGCTKFHDYIFGQADVIVETDHRPLIPIFTKPLHQCPLRLQRMRLRLQRYAITLQYKPDKELFLADALPRFPNKMALQEEAEQFQVNVLDYVSASEHRLKTLRDATNEDPALIIIREYAETAWPEHKHGVPEPGRPYCREEVHAQDGLVFRSNKVIIPKSKRAEIMQLLHAAHAGADKMKARASSVMFWPNMSADINQFCKTCKVCQMHQPRNQKMPLLSHDVPTLPWESVGVDLFHYGGREFAVMVDFYSFFFEVRELRHTTSNALKTWCAQVFLVHGLPQKLYSDNGPPFSSSDFLRKLDVVHVTSSPYHPRSNGMAERAVQEAKKLLKKCSFRTPDFEIALLEWRNTPRDPVLKSPVQRLMGRQTRTLLPVPTIHLEPEAIPSKEVHDRLQTIRRRQKIHYDRSARNLSPLTPGQRVTTYDTLQRTWAPAIVLRPAATPRSTIVKTEDGHEIRRTREHLREAAPQPEPESTSQGPSEDDLQSGQQQLRRSTRLRREPCRYPLPDETSRPYHH
ncbi:uncharacterized protein [Dermacentor andersoni]|uniref:uncharacterized protein isoform X1 n=1 Tax=Dermacentor andersoni TaxID=34620 RepID=UPI002415CC3A|nr:uncharacterized protein LOC126546920 isoform X1 [Dermacentor andersoni]